MLTNQVGGWPPLSVTFQTEEDRQEVLARAASLVTDRASNIQVTRDTVVTWCNLTWFQLTSLDLI